MQRLLIILLLLIVTILGCASETVKIELKGPSGCKTFDISKEVESLRIGYSDFTDISGLDLLPQLKILDIGFMKEFSDFSFLADASNLETLSFMYAKLENFNFLLLLPELELLFIDDCEIKDSHKIDLNNNRKIEYIRIHSSGLKYLPEIRSVPESLKYLFLERNEIEKLTKNFILQTQSIPYISLNNNPLEEYLIAQGLSRDYILSESHANILRPEIYEFYSYTDYDAVISVDAP